MIRTFIHIYSRAIFWVILILIGYFLIKNNVFADVTPDFLNQGKDAESSIGTILKEVFEWVLYVAIGLGAIGAAMGLAETSGVFGQKEKGIDKIKTGLGVVAVGAVFLGIVAFFAGLGS